MGLGRSAIIAAVLLLGCEGSPRQAAWTFAYDPPSLADRAVAVEAIVAEGGCPAGSDRPYDELIEPGAAAPMPPRLAPGRYALAGRARDGECVVFAEGCREVELPLEHNAVIEVTLRAASAVPACEPSVCRDGICIQPLDAGRGDGGTDAAVPPDGGPGEDASFDSGGRRDAAVGDAAACDPLVPPTCSGSDLVRCEGGMPVTEMCPLGCAGSPGACQIFVPSNIAGDVTLAPGLADISVDSTVPGGTGSLIWVFDTDNGAIDVFDAMDPGRGSIERIRGTTTGVSAGIGYQRIDSVPAGAPRLGVFTMASLVVAPGTTLVGVGERALVLYVGGDVRIDGVVRSDADPRIGDSGGRSRIGAASTSGGLGGGDGTGAGRGLPGNDVGGETTGGGGGGFGSAGGDGRPGSAGTTYGSAELVPLVAGSGGGGGGGGSAGGRGGRGGGALQISAHGTVTVAAGGQVTASGTGGTGGLAGALLGDGGGGGGGSGGAILLEAPVVVLAGAVAANGGGGGGGTRSLAAGGFAGGPGDAVAVPASGGAAAGGGSAGGAGSGCGGTVGAGGMTTPVGGGGGGGAGRIRINTAAGTETFGSLCPTTTSGAASVGPVHRAPPPAGS